MKHQHIKRVVAAMTTAATVLLFPFSVHADDGAGTSRVGEYAYLNSGGQQDQTGGTSTGTTMTDAERQAAQTNSTAARSISTKVGYYLNQITDDFGCTIQTPGSYTFITEGFATPSMLREIMDSGFGFDPIGLGFDLEAYFPSDVNLSAGDLSAFQRVVNSQLGGAADLSMLDLSTLTFPWLDFGGFDWSNWDFSGFGSMDDFIRWLMNNGGYRIREDLDGGFIDFPDIRIRYEMLEAYLNATSSEDTIRTQYILEFRIESTVRDTIYKMVGRNGANSYVWNFRNLDTGEAYRESNLGASIFHQFMRAGTYEIQVEKEVLKSYCNALTFSVNEYWIVADTGQIIYRQETKGRTLDPEIPALEQGFKNVVLYDLPAADIPPSIEINPVASMWQVVTEDMLNQTIPAEGSFRTFTTERVA